MADVAICGSLGFRWFRSWTKVYVCAWCFNLWHLHCEMLVYEYARHYNVRMRLRTSELWTTVINSDYKWTLSIVYCIVPLPFLWCKLVNLKYFELAANNSQTCWTRIKLKGAFTQKWKNYSSWCCFKLRWLALLLIGYFSCMKQNENKLK